MSAKKFVSSFSVSKRAVFSGICAILALFIPGILKALLCIAAIILGVFGFKKIEDSHGVLYGKSMAVGGIVISSILIVIFLFGGFRGGDTVSTVSRGRRGVIKYNAKHVEECRANLKKIKDAIESYQEDHKDQYPQTLSDLYPDYIENSSVFWCPGDSDSKKPAKIESPEDALISYSYNPPRPDSPQKLWELILVTDNAYENHGGAGKNILMGDGMVHWIKRPIKRQKKK